MILAIITGATRLLLFVIFVFFLFRTSNRIYFVSAPLTRYRFHVVLHIFQVIRPCESILMPAHHMLFLVSLALAALLYVDTKVTTTNRFILFPLHFFHHSCIFSLFAVYRDIDMYVEVCPTISTCVLAEFSV